MSLCTSTTVACYVFSSPYGIRIVPWCIEGRSPHLTSACTAKCATEVWEGCDISSTLKILSFSGLFFLAAEVFSELSFIEQRFRAIVANALWSWISARLDCVCASRVRSFARYKQKNAIIHISIIFTLRRFMISLLLAVNLTTLLQLRQYRQAWKATSSGYRYRVGYRNAHREERGLSYADRISQIKHQS